MILTGGGYRSILRGCEEAIGLVVGDGGASEGVAQVRSKWKDIRYVKKNSESIVVVVDIVEIDSGKMEIWHKSLH